MYEGLRGRMIDPFLMNYTAKDLRIASEFLANWIPFLCRGLCPTCTRTLYDRVRSLDSEVDGVAKSTMNHKPEIAVPTFDNTESNESSVDLENCDANSLGSWKEAANINDTADTSSLRSWKDGANDWSEPITEASASATVRSTVAPVRMSWADMAQEDEFGGDEESEVSGNSVDGHARSGEDSVVINRQKPKLSRDQREFIRLSNVKRKKDFICLERFKGKIVNILDGLELHTGVFSTVEQNRIVDFVYTLQEMGKKGELKDRTFTAPAKWMRGKGRVTIQFGCCYNYAYDKNGNPPGILRSENVDPIPDLFKVIIRRLVRWHVLPPSCVPDSCIVNIYDEGDCIPPHIDNHDFVRPFCTVSFLSECNILFGSNLKVLSPGEFDGPMAIPLPVGSVLVLNGNGADVAKHCVPAVPTKRISITFRKMDESKRPYDFVPEPDLQGLEPLSYETGGSNRVTQPKPNLPEINRSGRGILETPKGYPTRQGDGGENHRDRSRGSFGRGKNHLGPGRSFQIQARSSNMHRVKLNLDD